MVYYKWLDGLKGILCVLIVLYHYTSRFTDLYNIKFFPSLYWGAEVGVTAFLLISVFLTMSTIDNIRNGSIKWFSNKFKRLWIPYLVCTTLTFIALKVFGLPGRDSCGLYELIKDFFMLPFLSGHIEGATWYVLELIRFYILIFIINIFIKYDSFPAQLLILTMFFVTYLFPQFKYLNILMGKLPIYLGGILFLMLNEKKYLSILFSYFLLILYSQSAYVVITCVVMFFLFYSKQSCSFIYVILSTRFLCSLGAVSYVWYLLHQNIGYILMLRLQNIIILPLIPYASLLVTFLLSLIVSQLLIPFITGTIELLKTKVLSHVA